MSLIPNSCVEFDDNRATCIAFENGKTYRLENSLRVKIRKIKVDKCLKQKEGQRRCDYLIIINDLKIKRAIFIELKGGALNEAIKQIYETINFLKDEFVGFKLDARIVGSKDVPNFITTPHYRKLARLVLPNGSILRSTNKIYLENL